MVTYSPQQRRDAQRNSGEASGSRHGFWAQHSIWLLVEIGGETLRAAGRRGCCSHGARPQRHSTWRRDAWTTPLRSSHRRTSKLVVAAPLVDALRGSPTEPLALPDHTHHLPLRLLRRGAFPLSLMLIAPAAELLAVTTSPAAAAAGSSERWGNGNRESCTSRVAAVPAVIVSPLPCTLELASRSSLTGRRTKEEEIKGERK
uniref:Uncharacterized protein n=1 Tax=Oryza barthii TaxID=65489 RepID=A0A0D3G0T0_9ORYZ